jgi:flagellar basal-body rod protein FlgC
MTIFNTFDISASGLSAQRQRLNVISENMANVNTTRMPGGGPYRRKNVVLESEPMEKFASMLETPEKVKVVAVKEDPQEPRVEFDPTHPDADDKGMVAMPNVNPVLEMVNLTMASRAFDANVSVIRTAKTMAQKAIEIGR